MKYSQARDSLRQLDIGTKLESSRQTIRNEAKSRNLDQKFQASLKKIGGASQKIGGVVGGATHRIRDKVQSIDVQEAKEKIGTAVGDVKQKLQGSPRDNEDIQHLRRRLRDDRETLEATKMMQEAEAACKQVIITHLNAFVEKKPTGTYEQWLRELHPENDYEGQLLEGFSEIDHRLYVEQSDHLIMWNENLNGIRIRAEPKYRTGGHIKQDTEVVDLLS